MASRFRKFTSSGMPTSGQSGHFGLSTSGGGTVPPAVASRKPSIALRFGLGFFMSFDARYDLHYESNYRIASCPSSA